ncbi:hypothetical protein GCM10020331_031260 [Ectobacillus funiculus]
MIIQIIFADINDVFSAFQEMALQVNKGIIACGDDEQLQRMQAKVPVIFYGFDEHNDFQARNIQKGNRWNTFLMCLYEIRTMEHFRLRDMATIVFLNALAVIALCHYENISIDIVKEQLTTFGGA